MSDPNEPNAPAGASIQLHGVSAQFGANEVLRDISLSIESGRIAAFLGTSGAGKTTLLRIIMGLLRPARGAVEIDGVDIATLTARALNRARAKWSMVFQYSALLDSLSVFDNVALPLREHESLKATQVEARVSEMLESLELAGSEQRMPNELSGGMRKRVAIARALIRRPSLIAYDEPASGLDPLTARLVDQLILRSRKGFAVTSIVITHDVTEVQRLADRVFVLERGRLVAEGSFEQLRAQKDGLAAKFIEASQMK